MKKSIKKYCFQKVFFAFLMENMYIFLSNDVLLIHVSKNCDIQLRMDINTAHKEIAFFSSTREDVPGQIDRVFIESSTRPNTDVKETQ